MLKKNISYGIYAIILIIYFSIRKTTIFTSKISYELLSKIQLEQNYLLVLNILIAIITITIVNKNLEIIKIKKQQALITSILFTITPAFIFTTLIYTKYNLTLLSLLIAMYYIIKKDDLKSTLSIVIFGLFGFEEAILGLFILITYFILNKKQSMLPILLTIPIVLNFPTKIQNNSIILELISDIGTTHGFGFITIIFAIIGITIINKKTALIVLIYSTIVLILANYLNSFTTIYLIIPITYLGGFSLNNFLKNKEALMQIKKLTKLLILCGLLFSSLAHIKLLANEEPSKQIFEISEILENATKIYSKNPKIIEYYAKIPSEYTEISSTREFIDLTKEYSHIYFTEPVNEQYIKLALEDSKTFKKIYDKNNQVIYKIEVNK